jgi:hypothetical protein
MTIQINPTRNRGPHRAPLCGTAGARNIDELLKKALGWLDEQAAAPVQTNPRTCLSCSLLSVGSSPTRKSTRSLPAIVP